MNRIGRMLISKFDTVIHYKNLLLILLILRILSNKI